MLPIIYFKKLDPKSSLCSGNNYQLHNKFQIDKQINKPNNKNRKTYD